MAVYKCKMCGGTVEFEDGSTVGVCDSCGTRQTLPRLDTERKANLYDRADHFRRGNDFDKAAGIYEQILNEDPSDAEAYWSLVLCRYGIEYVEDPSSHKRVPTVNRAQFTSIFDDEDYKSALQHADIYQRALYEEEANTINEIQKGILAISQNEEPFDIFICYKETDNNGRRTPDSVLANDLYYQLTQEGFKVFFSRITLEDKLGTAYEPYIFAALNSAKIMVVLGTRPEYFNAVWVKNEWSRYLALVKQSKGRKVLIPAYRDMDPYDLPEEFSHLQAQDMSKLGFMQDLIRGIKKITEVDKQRVSTLADRSENTANTQIAPLLRRAFILLEDGEWDRADDLLEQVLNQDPENAEAYLGKFMTEYRIRKKDGIADKDEKIVTNSNFQRAFRYADKSLRDELDHYISLFKDKKDQEEYSKKLDVYSRAEGMMNSASTEYDFRNAGELFLTIRGFNKNTPDSNNADAMAELCFEMAENAHKDSIYTSALSKMKGKNIANYENAIKQFETIIEWKDSREQIILCEKRISDIRAEKYDAIYDSAREKMTIGGIYGYEYAIQQLSFISDWKDAKEQILICQKEIERIKAREEEQKLERERKIEAERIELERIEEEKRVSTEKAVKKRKKMTVTIISLVAACALFAFLLNFVFIPNHRYNSALKLYDDQKYEEAYNVFNVLNYKDSSEKAGECLFLIQKNSLSDVTIGSIIKFGSYEQDSNVSNGKEEIEWRVLAIEGNKALVISQHALSYQPFNTNDYNAWEYSSLRYWLNDTFYMDAFWSGHKELIVNTLVTADPNPTYNTSVGKDVTDNVFLLGINEVNQYFIDDNDRRCYGTGSYLVHGAYDNENYCWWWLRTPGMSVHGVAFVNLDGSVQTNGVGVGSNNGAVRPAMWIEIE